MSFLVAAYAALWIGVFAYLLWLAARLRELRKEVRRLTQDAGPRRSARDPEPAGVRAWGRAGDEPPRLA